MSYGICHISEEELQQNAHGKPELLDLGGSGLFFCPSENLHHIDFSHFSSDTHAAALKGIAMADLEEKKRQKAERDEQAADEYEVLRAALQAKEAQLVLEGKRRRS